MDEQHLPPWFKDGDLRSYLWHNRLLGDDFVPWIGHYRSCNKKSFEIPFVRVKNFTIGYITEGSGSIEHTGKRMEIRPGSILFRFPGVVMKQQFDVGYFSECYLALPKSGSQFFLEMGLISRSTPVIDFKFVPDVVSEFDRLLESCRKLGPDGLLLSYGHSFNFVCRLLHKVRLHEGGCLDKMDNAVRMLNDPEEYSLTIPRLAARLDLNASTFRKMFQERYHVSPAEFRIRKRLDLISAQLLQSDMSVTELAEKHGYPDVFTFSRQFKRFTGMTPTQYRQRHGRQ